MKKIIFILSSLNDVHYQKRICDFMENGYSVKVYGFKRRDQEIPLLPYEPVILGEIDNGGYLSRLLLFYKRIRRIAKECKGFLCFYSSLDIALFATRLIQSPYIYECCDLTELTILNKNLRNWFVKQNYKTIKNSLHSILTSDGFAEFFSSIPSDKYTVIPNAVSPNCSHIDIKRGLNPEKIKIGFVGVIRFSSTYNFIKACIENCKNVEIHLFGIYSKGDIYADKVMNLEKEYENIIFHGRFSNPIDLPNIYSQIDLLLCAYPPVPSVVYAEPNKLYEALFFDCPIIVSDDTFLGRKVNKLGIGYVINAKETQNVVDFINNLTIEDYNNKVQSCASITKEKCFNDLTPLFNKLNTLRK